MKPFWKSKTIIFNAIVAVVAGAVEFLPALQANVDPQVYAYLFFTVSVINVALRKVTTQGISLKE
jgi:anti-sigma-K factor RskA